MKRALVALVVLFSLVLVTSVYAQNWDGKYDYTKLAKGKEFKFSGEIVSIDPKGQTAIVKVNDKQYLGRFDYAKYEGAYKGVAELKVGEKIVGVGVVVDGYNWITKVADASKLPVPVKEGVAPR